MAALSVCNLEHKGQIFGLECLRARLHTRAILRGGLRTFGKGTEGLHNRTTRKKGSFQMASDKQNLQDAFLNHVRKAKVPVTIFLINGVKLQGVITWFDNFCVLLRRDGQSQLVYKHAISTIMPGAPISLYEGED
jgi:host factor-I protein